MVKRWPVTWSAISPGHEVYLTYEAGCCGFVAARFFLDLGWQVLVVNASDVPRSDEQYYQKTDKLDCMNLSRQLRAGQLRGIYIPDQQHDQLKNLLRHRTEVTRQLRSVKQHIKSLLLCQGVDVPRSLTAIRGATVLQTGSNPCHGPTVRDRPAWKASFACMRSFTMSTWAWPMNFRPVARSISQRIFTCSNAFRA